MKKRRATLLIEVMVCFFLVFTVSMVLLGMLQTSDAGYSQAAQVRVALKLAQESMENVRAGNLKPTSQKLNVVSLRLGRAATDFQPILEVSTVSGAYLVRSRVTWSQNGRNHSVELKTFVPQ